MEEDVPTYNLVTNDVPKYRDGRYGPVFQVIDDKTVTGLAIERLDLPEPTLSRALSKLPRHKPRGQPRQHGVLEYIGYQRQGSYAYLITEIMHGGSLRQLIQDDAKGALPVPLSRSLTRHLVRGLEEIYAPDGPQGLAEVLLDADEIWVDSFGVTKIEPPLLDAAVVGAPPLRPAALTLPEIVFGREGGYNLRKADVWLLGIVVAQMLSGRAELVADYLSATTLGAKITAQGRTGSGLELLLPDFKKALPEDAQALDFLRQCLTVNSDERPTIAELRNHPFLAEVK